MAVENPALFLQGGSHTAEYTRRLIDALVEGREGIVGAGDLLVTENGTPNMTVNVAAGRAFVNGSENAFQGTYFCEARSTTNLAVSAAHATLARKDLVVAKVEDAAYSGGVNAWSLAVVAGTPAGSPAEPTAPANSMVLAMIDVPAADTTITNSQITDRRTSTAGQGRATALGGIIVCTSTTRPAHSEGRVIYETDTDKLKTSNGAAWNDVTPANAFSFVRKTADESVTSSTTLQNDDHLVLPVAASTVYVMEAALAVNYATAAQLKLAWTGPAGATMRWGMSGYSATLTSWVTAIGTAIVDAVGSNLVDHMVMLSGILVVSTTAGNLQLQWAQNASNATATKLLQGSWLRLTPVA